MDAARVNAVDDPFHRCRGDCVAYRATGCAPRPNNVGQLPTSIRDARCGAGHLSEGTGEGGIRRVNGRDMTCEFVGPFHATCHGVSCYARSLFFFLFRVRLPTRHAHVDVPRLFVCPFLEKGFFVPSTLCYPSVFRCSSPIKQCGKEGTINCSSSHLVLGG